jgi:hypothetical protein
MDPVAARPPAVRRPAGGPAALARAAVCAPVSARARRELLFCLAEVPLGLCVLAVPVALAGLPLLAALLANGGQRPPRPVQAHPAGGVSLPGGAIIVMLFALLFLVPRIARGLGAAHRRLAARLLGERVAAPGSTTIEEDTPHP